jgi:ElaA protein
VNTQKLNIVKKRFTELTTVELYALMRLRAVVFVLEQNCPYIDPDNQDQEAFHLLGYHLKTNELVAYARILKPGAYKREPSIGRLVTDKRYRSQQFGKLIFTESIAWCEELFPERTIRIMAQEYLIRFYEGFGFQTDSDPFLEDDIWHVDMTLELNQPDAD